jgi:hypothetical protein
MESPTTGFHSFSKITQESAGQSGERHPVFKPMPPSNRTLLTSLHTVKSRDTLMRFHNLATQRIASVDFGGL